VDVLSDVIAVMRTGRPHAACVRRQAPWGQHFTPVPGAGFHVILRGSCWLVPDVGAPFALGAGDVVFLPNGRGHGLADSPSTALTEHTCDPHDLSELDRRDTVSDVGAPAGEVLGTTVTLCGAYQLDLNRVRPLLRDLPEIVHLPARPGHRPEMRAAVDLLGGEVNAARPGGPAVVPALLDAMLVYILRAWLAERAGDGSPTGWASALRDGAVGAALRGIHHDPARPWTVATLGALAGLSRAAFARRFTSLVGQPPMNYVTWWRMTLAARLLRESDAPRASSATRSHSSWAAGRPGR